MKIKKVEEITKLPSILIYGDSGAGKTYLISTLPVERWDEVLYVGVDPGQRTLRDRCPGLECVEPPKGGFKNADRRFFDDILRYIKFESTHKWVAVDGLDDFGEIILEHEKDRTTNLQRAYGEMAWYMKDWLLAVRDISKGVIFTTHSVVERMSDNETVILPSFPGQMMSRRIRDYFDFVFAVRYIRTEGGIKRVLQTTKLADVSYEAKERGGKLSPFEPPDLTLILNKIEYNLPVADEEKQPPAPVEENDIVTQLRKNGITRKMFREKFGTMEIHEVEKESIMEWLREMKCSTT